MLRAPAPGVAGASRHASQHVSQLASLGRRSTMPSTLLSHLPLPARASPFVAARPAAPRRPLPAPRAAAAENGKASALSAALNVFSDPKCNSKMVALAVGQLLCSIATLMHDAYLPVYVHDVMGLTNTQVRRA